ncbi:alpha/beta hydrolase [Pseudidiomarina sp.]|uniref:alpha/beta hydrolase n=1 Tax=Pseudidiomarina sp. TaxID=2081707 RepID=UPI00299EE497|nr:alpha/beta hydrolase [Pseudidiomarina sp.]MDX1705160.1 alpha/beta hydrolase [Pseudidiomarina sp.]
MSETLNWQQARHLAGPVAFELNWGTVRGLSWGPATGKPILALHGWLDNAHSFIPMAEAFLQSPLSKSRRLIALDWAGHGCSDHRPPGNYYPFVDYVYDVWQLCELQGWEQIDIIAHSMGAFAANMLAGIDPDRVANLLSIEAFGLLATPSSETAGDIRKGFKSRWLQQQKDRPHYPNLQQAVAARQMAGDFSAEIAALLVDRGIEKLSDEDYRFRADGQLRVSSAIRMTAEQIGDVLAKIKCPFELVIGSEGHERVQEALGLWRSLVPQLQVHTIAGGHHVHMQEPAAIIDLFGQMIDRQNG